jgi:hypothetical protein
MIIYLNSLLKNKKLFKYLLIGTLNTMFAYTNSILIFNLFYKNIGALLVTLIASIINIFFSLVTYKFFYFKTHKKFFFKELIKINISYIIIFIINSSMLWVLIEKIEINIYITQLFIIFFNITISILINFNYVFKK